jgi:hypothetical protein
VGYKTGLWSWISHGWRDLHGSINLGQHIESFVILVKLSGHCEIATVDEEVRGRERRLERSGWLAMFFRAQRCVVGVADDEDPGFDGWT